MLVEGRLLTEEQLGQALVDKRKTDMKLGQFLVREGIVNESQIVDLIAKQLHLNIYSPDKYPVDTGLSDLIPTEMAQKYQAVPLRKRGPLLTLAMTDPMDINALDAIEVLTNTEVEAVICTEQELNQLSNSLYGTYSGIGNVLEDLQFDTEQEAENAGTDGDVQVSSLQDMAEGAPVVRLVNSVLAQAVRDGASDVHVSPEKLYVQVRFRVDGRLHEVPAPPKTMILPMISRLKILANMDIASSRIPQDGRFSVKLDNKEINIRVSTIPTIYGENVVLRLLDTSAGTFTLNQLGMSDIDRQKIESAIVKPYGMILSTGPTGSGKSTTLFSVLREINKPDINIITLEDPVEYRVEKIRQVQLNTKAGMTFASGLRSILRQDPDVIMVGEIRDLETANVSVQAALTGHRVLSTVHTNDAAGAISRFVDMGIEPFLVSSVMLALIGQRLIRRVCPQCMEPFQPTKAVLENWGLEDRNDGNYVRHKGCFNCMESGYKGRTGLYEVLIIDEMIQDLIVQGKSSPEISRAAKESGNFATLKDHAAQKVAEGITTFEEAASGVMS
jgi:type IV pilus assembly protein PilB